MANICLDLKAQLIEICTKQLSTIEQITKKTIDTENGPKEVIDQKIPGLVEAWIQADIPARTEQARMLVKFMSKLKIPNETLFEWLNCKDLIYQRTSDMLLQYIADNWTRDKVNIGEYLI